jgi:hypothetical protein
MRVLLARASRKASATPCPCPRQHHLRLPNPPGHAISILNWLLRTEKAHVVRVMVVEARRLRDSSGLSARLEIVNEDLEGLQRERHIRELVRCYQQIQKTDVSSYHF